MASITITRPDDWHCHLRDGAVLERTVADTAREFERAIAMPNLRKPVTTVDAAREYRERILSTLPESATFTPIMTLYLTEQMAPQTLVTAAQTDYIRACKYYPAGATTLSDAGVRDLKRIYPLLETMQKEGLLLLMHGESIDPEVDIFDREAVFIERHLQPILRDFPELKIVLEHISTAHAVQFVQGGPSHLAATITPHHLWLNRNHLLVGGVKPHYYCLPIVKRSRDQAMLIAAATSGDPSFFLGTDSAPHAQHRKESPCGCAGIYSAHAAIELYAEVFATHDALDKLNDFAAHFGADFYGLPRNTATLTLVQRPWRVPEQLSFGEDTLIPFAAGETLSWQLQSMDNV